MTKIPWTEETWNPVTGCTKIAAGCKNCYAESIAKRFWGDRPFTDVQCHEDRLDIPLHWKKPRKIFVCSMGDLFHEKVPVGFIQGVYETITDDNCQQHIFQLLTKRPERMLDYHDLDVVGALPNLWLGTSVSTQADADKNIPILLQIPAAVRYLSVEPMLEEINITNIDTGKTWPFKSETSKLEPLIGGTYSRRASDPDGARFMDTSGSKIDWVIIGCESGLGARLCSIEDIRNAVGQCKTANVPVFVKQVPINGKCNRNLKEWPEDLRIQEYPR